MGVGVWWMAKREARDPRGAVMPQPLSNSEVADLSDGSQVEAFGYSLRLPWKVSKRSDRRTLSTLTLSNGASVTLVDNKDDPSGPGILAKSTPREAATYRIMYGDEAMSSRYAFIRAEFRASPSDVSFWHSRASNLGTMTNLIAKDGMIGKANVVYSLAVGSMRGFQVGNPGQSTPAVWLRLFDGNDREIWIILRRPLAGEWTQKQINAIVASIRPPG